MTFQRLIILAPQSDDTSHTPSQGARGVFCTVSLSHLCVAFLGSPVSGALPITRIHRHWNAPFAIHPHSRLRAVGIVKSLNYREPGFREYG
jgi:hypothetical protein